VYFLFPSPILSWQLEGKSASISLKQDKWTYQNPSKVLTWHVGAEGLKPYYYYNLWLKENETRSERNKAVNRCNLDSILISFVTIIVCTGQIVYFA
jgi:hypothetical protein